MGRLICFGFGFSAEAVARPLLAQGWNILGTTRDLAKSAAWSMPEIMPYRFDRAHPLQDAAFEGVTHVLISIPPDAMGDAVLDLHASVLAGLKSLQWVGYLSTTGVYGDRGGDWVDEDSDLRPSQDRSRKRVLAEQGWLEFGARYGTPVQVFRLAGIYGRGRSALDAVRAGRAQRLIKPGQVFSRIHVEDIARVLLASIAKPHAGRIYNVCDDDPAPPQDVIAEACRLLGRDPLPDIPFDPALLSPMAQSFYADNKRVCNDRIKQELGVELLYPSYREGLRAILAAESPP